MKQPFLKGKLIYLRGIRKYDLRGNYLNWFNDQDVCRHNSHGRYPMNKAKLEEYYKRVNKSGSDLVLAIITKKGNVHIGNVSLQNIDWVSRSAEFAIIIGEKGFWGKGIGREAADLIIKHGFSSLNMHRIYCGTQEDNVAMQRLAVYLGMKKEGLRREAIFKNNKFRDIIEYGILAKEYLKKGKG